VYSSNTGRQVRSINICLFASFSTGVRYDQQVHLGSINVLSAERARVMQQLIGLAELRVI